MRQAEVIPKPASRLEDLALSPFDNRLDDADGASTISFDLRYV